MSPTWIEVATWYREVKIFGGQQQEEDRFLQASSESSNMKMVITRVFNEANETIIEAMRPDRRALQPRYRCAAQRGKAVEFLVLVGMLDRPIKS